MADSTLRNDRFEFDGVNAAVFECTFERAVHELVLLDQRLSSKRYGAHRHVEMIHRSGTVEDADLRIGEFGTNEIGQRAVFDHERSLGEEPEPSASASPRASPSVSGRRVAPLLKAAVTPLARTMPVTPSRTAGMPLARRGPISIVKVRWTRARPRKNARRERPGVFIGSFYGASARKAWLGPLRKRA